MGSLGSNDNALRAGKKMGIGVVREEGSWASSGRWASCGLYGRQADGGWHGDGGHVLGLVDEDLATFPALLPCREGFPWLHSPAQARPLLVSQAVPRPSHPAIGPRVVFLAAVTLAACFRNAALAVLLHVR